MPNSFKIGLNAKLYRNTGTHGAPVWAEIENCKDLTAQLQHGEADMSSRGSGGWKVVLATLKEGEFSFQIVPDLADADYTALRDSFLNRTTVEYAIMLGSIVTAGEQGLRVSCQVLQFQLNQQLAEGQLIDIVIKPAPSDNAPSWHTVP